MGNVVVVPLEDRPFGVEFEFTRSVSQEALQEAVLCAVPGAETRIAHWEHTPNDNSDWVVKFDGSCGWEIATPKSFGWVGLDRCCAVLGKCREVGARVNGRCGVHIHYEVRDHEREDIGRMLAWWVRMEGFLYLALPRRRRGNPFCVKLSQVCGLRPNHGYSARDLVELCGGSRRRALNIEPWRRDNYRVEVRVLEGMLDPVDLAMWVKYFMYFIHRARESEMPGGLNWFDVDGAMRWLRWYSPDGGWGVDWEMAGLRRWYLGKVVRNCSPRAREARHMARAREYLEMFS